MAKLKDEITYADVILPLPVKGRFSYEVPEKLMENNLVGKRVLVQFGKRKLYAGLISNVYAEKPQGYTVKPILDIIDTKPLVDENLLSFWEWIADYYLCEIGEVMNAGLPASLKLSSETKVRLNPFFENHESVVSTELSRKQSLVIESIGYRKSLTMAQLQDVLEQKTIYPVINELIDQDILEISESIKESYSPKKVSFVQLKPELKDTTVLEETMDRLEKAPKQLALFMACLELDIEEEPIRKSYLFGKVGKEESALKGLVKNDVVEIVQKEVSRLELDEEPKDLKFELADEQQKALEEIKKHFKNKNVVLLHGVTSSGKTYIYIRLIEEILRKKEQVLYLLPEIALTTQIINKLRAYFGNIVGVYHSKYNAKEKVEIWNKVLKQEYKIIIGARSAVFLPFRKLGLAIVDEEHDASYKQFDPAPRYNARDCSIYLAGIHKAKVLLGTATPSIESSYNAYGEKYGLVKLDKRYGGFDLPEMVIADKKKDVQTRFKHSHFTSSLIEELQATRKNAEQSILFQNRRGYVPYMECNQCGWIPNCIRCDVSLTYHKYTDNLRCHYCGYSIKMVTSCPSCTSTNISIHGFGTELIEEELNQLLPGISVSRMDWDTTRSKHGHEKIISSFESGSIDVLVGTQMVTKSLDFDNVTLVGILSAENLFNFPDFRANERAFQMISQVSGRAGRKSKKGKVIIQTFDAKNPLLQMIMKNDYEAFYKGEINQRKLFKYPPFYRLIKFSIKHETKFKTEQAANHLAALLKKIGKIEMLGPEFPPIPRIRNKYIKNILVKMHPAKKSLSKLKSEIRTQLEGFHSNQNFKSVLVHIDVDPLD